MSPFNTTFWQHDKVGATAATEASAPQSRSQSYRAMAAECQLLANRWPDDLVRQQYAELARQWRDLAEHAEGRR
jgi:hypothetical protein